MLEMVMCTMSFSDKLNAMEERLTGLTSRVDTPGPAKTGTRKLCSRRRLKHIIKTRSVQTT